MGDRTHRTAQPPPRRRPGRPRNDAAATWDDATSALLLRLRFDEMKARFAACQTTLSSANVWAQLADELNARRAQRNGGEDSSTDVHSMRFASQQCQNKAGIPHAVDLL